MTDLVDYLAAETVQKLIERSSFGPAGAQQLRARTSGDIAETIVERLAAGDDDGRDALLRVGGDHGPDAVFTTADGHVGMVEVKKFRRTAPPPAGEDRYRGITSLEDVMGAARAGDDDATQELLNRVAPSVLVYCRARIGSKHGLVEDIAQEVCLQALLALPTFPGSADDFLALTFRTASTVVDTFDTKFLTTGGEISDASPTDRFSRLVSSLPTLAREVIVLRIAVGLAAEEVGGILGISPGRVRVTQHRALTTLRTKVSELDEQTPSRNDDELQISGPVLAGSAVFGVSKRHRGNDVTHPRHTRASLSAELVKKYKAGASIRSLAESTGQSYSFVHRLLSEAGVLRHRGRQPRTTKPYPE